MRFLRYLCLIILAAGVLGSPVQADNWPSWRGPDVNGVAQAADYPLDWNEGESLLWKVKMPAHAGSTPIIWGDQIFLTVAEAGKNLACCYDWQGQLLWRTEVGDEREGKHKKASGCNSSPVTDGEHVYVYFKSGDLACLDMSGNIVWQTNLQQRFGEDTLWWDLGTSPVLTHDCVVVAVIQSGPSYLVGFDKESGDVAWKVDRILEAPEEANQTYSTPLVINDNDRQMLVAVGADHVTAHDATNGRELWRVGGLNPSQNGYFRSISSPVYSDGVIVAPYARGKTLTAISLAGDVLWRGDEISADVPTPAALDGKVFVCNDKGRLACLDIRTGSELWSVETGKHRTAFSASPILAGNRIYLTREDGTVFVVDAEGKAGVVATNELDEFTVATPVLSHGKILLRTADHLYCFGRKEG